MYDIIRLTDRPEMKKVMAEWFHAKWGIPLEAYIESMDKCLECGGAYPQWYAAVEEGRMIAGMGVIENDFHDRKELSPNICAVYTDEEYRGRGIAGRLLKYVCEDMHASGIDTLYLVTDHDSFYERYGWEFLCMVQSGGGEEMSRMYVHNM